VVFKGVTDAYRLEQIGHLPDGLGVAKEEDGTGRKLGSESSQQDRGSFGRKVDENVAAKDDLTGGESLGQNVGDEVVMLDRDSGSKRPPHLPLIGAADEVAGPADTRETG
jgi:hypothetical protein